MGEAACTLYSSVGFYILLQFYLEWSFAVCLKKWQLKKTSGKRIMCSFMCFISYIKICYLYLNKSRSVGEHCKAYKLKSEVFTNHSCSMYLRTRDGTVVRTLASYHFGRVISRTLLLMSAEFVVDPRLFPRRFSSGSPCFLFSLN